VHAQKAYRASIAHQHLQPPSLSCVLLLFVLFNLPPSLVSFFSSSSSSSSFSSTFKGPPLSAWS
jgi:hypothetical protein